MSNWWTRVEEPCRAVRFVFAALFGLAIVSALGSPSKAAPIWNQSGPATAQTINCIGGNGELLGTAWAEWLGDRAAPPQVGAVYYIGIKWGVTGNPCLGGARGAPEFFLPDGATLAISAANPVRCFVWVINSNTFTPETAACPQAPAAGLAGGMGFYPKTPGITTWPAAQGKGWEIQVPVISTRPLNGMVTSPDPAVACPSCVTVALRLFDGVTNPWLTPRVGVNVGGSATPTITYRSPSTVSITQTTARGYADLDPAGTTGDAFVQISAAPPAGSQCVPSGNRYAVGSNFANPLFADWSGLSPGTTYYWRFCYQTGGRTYWGSVQSFTTAGTPRPIVQALSRTIAAPGAQIKVIGRNLSGASVEIRQIVIGGPAFVGTAARVLPGGTDTELTFVMPDLVRGLIPYPAVALVTTSAGTAQSPAVQIDIDTVIDSVAVLDLDGSGRMNDARVSFHATEPFSSAEADCFVRGSGLAFSCRSGTALLRDLPPGANRFEAMAYVQTGYGRWADDEPASVDIMIAPPTQTPPDTAILSAPYGPVRLTTIDFTFTSPAVNATFECTDDLSWPRWSACISPTRRTGHSDGVHFFGVRARDSSGNVDTTPAFRAYTVDTVPPGIAILGGPAEGATTTDKSATFSFLTAAGDSIGVQCRLDGAPFEPALLPVAIGPLPPPYRPYARSCIAAFSNMATGRHTFEARAMDLAGNVTPTPAGRSWTIAP